MSIIHDDLKYTKTHEWIIMDDEFIGTCGISDHAQEMLTDIVFVELPEVGIEVTAGEQVAIVESVKAASDIYSPVTGEIVEVNKELEDIPGTVNTDPYGNGWLFKIDVKNKHELDDLMNASEYKDHVDSGE